MGYWVRAEDLEDPTSDDAADAALTASGILYALSGRKYTGQLTVTERYENASSSCGFGRGAASSYLGSGYGSSCGTHSPGIRLRVPVHHVHYLLVGEGASRREIDPAEYEVVNRTYLRPTRGASWSACSDIEVTYTCGFDPPAAGRRAALTLANQLLKARHNADDCQLPDRVTSVSRQGISITMLDPQDFLQDGRTGLYEVDLFLKSTNPDRARKRARVFSVDMKKGHLLSSSRIHSSSEYDLIFRRGLPLSRTFKWSSGGVDQPISGVWSVTASVTNSLGAQTFNLTPYLIIEAAGEVGRIDLEVPPAVTQSMNLFGEWSLVLTRIDDTANVVRLLSGNVLTSAY